MDAQPTLAEAAIRASALCKRYRAQVGRGCIFGRLGPNGAGKSTAIKILATLLALRGEQRMTILICTHDMEEAQTLCDRLAILRRGRIAATGSPADLKAAAGAGASLADAFVHFSGASIDSGQMRDLRESRAAAWHRG